MKTIRLGFSNMWGHAGAFTADYFLKWMMTHDDIQGWFDFQEFYDRMVDRAVNRARFAEIGCWRGKSTAYLARKILDSGKAIQLVCVDTWLGSANEPSLLLAAKESNIYEEFLNNMEACGVRGAITAVMRMESARAANQFLDHALDMVFLDGDHTEAGVARDIRPWLPKVKPGGFLAGHDWNTYKTVRAGVRACIGEPGVLGNVWFKEIES